MKEIYALVDCNNFFVSCERVFDPKLKNKPVVVLSNNDGCAISRSNEAKDLGIPMGAPMFKYQKLIKKYNIRLFSTNFVLYGDMSSRIMKTLSQFTPDIEIYSIDEAFLSLRGIKGDLVNYCRHIKETVRKCTGIPISIGIGPTKTLAKAANKLAKKHSKFNGVLNLTDNLYSDELLNQLDVGDVWGVGRKYAKILRDNGIYTALGLKKARQKWIREKMTIMGERTVKELKGQSCLRLERVEQPKKSILFSRSFGKPMKNLQDLSEAVSYFTSSAAEQLRKHKLAANLAMVFVATNRFKKNEPQYFNGINFRLPVATSYTPELINYSLQSLKKIYRSGYQYKKAGVMMLDLIPEDKVQLNMFYENPNPQKDRLMQIYDEINKIWGGGAIKYAAEGIKRPWRMRQLSKSMCFTTHWEELLKIKI